MKIQKAFHSLFPIVLVLALLFVGCSSQVGVTSDELSPDDAGAAAFSYDDEASASETITGETVVFDDGTFRLCVTGVNIVQDSMASILEIIMTNLSSDTYYSVDMLGCAVDGVQFTNVPALDNGFCPGCAGGETVTCELVVDNYPDDDSFFGRFAFTDIALSFGIEANGIKQQADVHVYPYGERAAAAYVLQTDDKHEVLLDNSYARITMVRGHKTEIFDLGFTMQLYVENKTDYYLNLHPEAAYVNAEYLYPEYCAINIEPGKSLVWNITWSDEIVRDTDVDQFNTISLDLVFQDAAAASPEPFLQETITFVPLINNAGL